jgi:hypothetical protein
VPGRPGVNRLDVETTDVLADASLSIAVELNRLDAAQTTRVPLMPAVGAEATVDGKAHWTADALTFPAGSAWDASVLVVDDGGQALSRQRFSFTLDDDGIAEGRSSTLPDPVTLVALLLAVGGTLAASAALAGARLPRCEAPASRLALLIGGTVAAALGVGLGVEQVLRLLG